METDNKQYYAYVYLNHNGPFYVGKGHKKRAYEHLKGNHYNPYLDRKIKKMLREGVEPNIKIINVNNEKEAFELEKFLIIEIGRHDLKTGPLLNLTDGGEGVTGHKKTPEQRRYQSQQQTGRKQNRPKGILHTAEWKKNQSIRFAGSNNPMYGKTLSDEWKAKASDRNSGENNPMYGKDGAAKGKLWYHDPITGKERYFVEGEQPENYVKGRGKYIVKNQYGENYGNSN